VRKAALALDAVFLAFALFFVVAASVFGQRGAEMPTDNWWLFGPMVGAGLAAIAGGVVALVAAVRGDRHAILSIPLALGGLAVLATVGHPLLVLPLIVAGLAWFLVLAKGRMNRRS
jgi:hypothetical protein